MDLVIYPAIGGIIITFLLSNIKRAGQMLEKIFILILFAGAVTGIILYNTSTGWDRLGYGLLSYISTSGFIASLLTALTIQFIKKNKMKK
jgi:ABC-type molybdate transport system permease subunit